MFILTRTKGKTTEMLKDSNSQFKKVFTTYSDAELLANKLNRHAIKNAHWQVHKLS